MQIFSLALDVMAIKNDWSDVSEILRGHRPQDVVHIRYRTALSVKNSKHDNDANICVISNKC
jgi:hypothetical protein